MLGAVAFVVQHWMQKHSGPGQSVTMALTIWVNGTSNSLSVNLILYDKSGGGPRNVQKVQRPDSSVRDMMMSSLGPHYEKIREICDRDVKVADPDH
jgi:hypothetical protein